MLPIMSIDGFSNISKERAIFLSFSPEYQRSTFYFCLDLFDVQNGLVHLMRLVPVIGGHDYELFDLVAVQMHRVRDGGRCDEGKLLRKLLLYMLLLLLLDIQ